MGNKGSTLPGITNLHQNSQTVNKGAAQAKRSSMKKVVKSKVAAQKWMCWADNGKNFNINISC